MDRVEEKFKSMADRLENTLDIIMEHFKETEERIEEIIDRIEDLEADSHPPVAPGGTTEIMTHIEELRNDLKALSGK